MNNIVGKFYFSPFSALEFCYALEPETVPYENPNKVFYHPASRQYQWAHMLRFRTLLDIIGKNFDDRCDDQREDEYADRLDLEGVKTSSAPLDQGLPRHCESGRGMSMPLYQVNYTLGFDYSLIPKLSDHHRAVYLDQEIQDYEKVLPVIDKVEAEKVLSLLRPLCR